MNRVKKEISLLDGEYWWGGIVCDGAKMPLGDTDLKRDLKCDYASNQTAPFLVSSMGRYIWSDEPIAYEFKSRILYIKSDGEIDFEDGYETLRGAYMAGCKKHFPPSKATPDALMFTSPQYNSWIEMMYEPTGEKIIKYAQSIIDNGMPTGVLMIDDNWQEDYGVWQFHPARFPKPKETIEKLHAMGFKVMLWVCNFFSPDSFTFRELEKKGYLVKDETGNTAITHWWNGYSGLIDLTNDDAVAWLHGIFENLMTQYGIDGFKFDAGDPDTYKDTFVSQKAITPLEYCRKWSEFGERYTLNEFRSGYKMGGRALAERLSDKQHSWDDVNGVASLIPNSLAQGLMGYAYTCPDMIGGGSFTDFLNGAAPDNELIVRYAECSALFPMMQFSVAPWRILSKENLDICVKMATLHQEYGDEILKLAIHASQTGEPIMRHMEYVFPHQGYAKINDQFMLGNEILVAPIVNKGAVSRSVVFPRGKWQGSETAIEGPCTVEFEAPLDKLLWFRRV